MRFVAILIGASSLLGAFLNRQDIWEVHEWGTFTQAVGSDGVPLEGLYRDEEALPEFVRSSAAPSGGPVLLKGLDMAPLHATVKMETPVLYFYSHLARQVRVRVGFPGGTISQWFPQADEYETAEPGAPLDFSRPRAGHIAWSAQILAPQAGVSPTAPPSEETPHWQAPRATAANWLRTDDGTVEKFLFYRGLGGFEVPLSVRFEDARHLELSNRGTGTIPGGLLYERRNDGSIRFHRLDGLAAQSTFSLDLDAALSDEKSTSPETMKATFTRQLVAAGLYPEEAKAMLATWHESYFERPGLRLFWIVPRPVTDALLPLEIDPLPQAVERVMVGRIELLAPAFESQLLKEYRAGKLENLRGPDRLYPAYLARVQALDAGPRADRKRPGAGSANRLYRSPRAF
jgi:hypothetical protein